MCEGNIELVFGLALLAFLKKHGLLHKKAIRKNIDKFTKEKLNITPIFHVLTMWSIKIVKKYLGGKEKGKKLETTNMILDYINDLAELAKGNDLRDRKGEVKGKIQNELKEREINATKNDKTQKKNIVCLENLQNYSPNELINVKGDGNCLFRCLARIIYSDEGEHNRMRSQVCDEFEKNQTIKNFLSKKERTNYLKEQGMRSNGTWGTEIEILCATALLKCSIFVFDYSKNLWLQFNIKDEVTHKWESDKIKRNIFLTLKNQHFLIVKNIKIKDREVQGRNIESSTRNDLKGGAIMDLDPGKIYEREI